jgi:hypothetical protein
MGIICMTPENRLNHWLHFEAGAICMAADREQADRGRAVTPYLLGLTDADLEQPIAALNAVPSTLEGTRKLMHSVNDRAALPARDIDRVIDLWWPALEEDLNAAAALEVTGAIAPRDDRSILEEVLTLARRITAISEERTIQKSTRCGESFE